MDLTARPALRLLPHLEPLTEFSAPFDTVTVRIDQDRGIMEIFAEHEVHPLDWDIACGLMERMGVRDIGEPSYLKGVDTWHVQFRPAAS